MPLACTSGMTAEAVLNQNEIEALLTGMKKGTVKTDPAPVPGDVRQYDLGTEARIVRGRMPTLEMINERFARLYRTSLYGILRRSAAISVRGIKTLKYSDYIQSLQVPTSLNMVKINPLRGTSLIVIAPRLVFSVVDNFFGGKGRVATMEGRDFTAAEIRIVQMLLQATYTDLKDAWSSVLDITIEFQASETNPQFANIVSASEVVVVSSFEIELDGSSGELHVTIPYSTLEPMREVLDAGAQGERAENDGRWAVALREEIEECDVDLTTVFGRGSMSLGDLINLRPGDVVPCDFQGGVTVYAEDVPILRGGFGVSRGQMAVQVNERLIHGRSPPMNSGSR
jgi:flagellar motor switch protein FliM